MAAMPGLPHRDAIRTMSSLSPDALHGRDVRLVRAPHLAVARVGDCRAEVATEVLVSGGYLISVRSLNIGRYIEMTMVPTMAPTQIMSSGSMIEVSDAMLASTSSS
jgi:hypothetical protein